MSSVCHPPHFLTLFQMLDDIERAVDDGVNSYKLLCRDARAVPAGGASEVEIARQLQALGRKVCGDCCWIAGSIGQLGWGSCRPWAGCTARGPKQALGTEKPASTGCRSPCCLSHAPLRNATTHPFLQETGLDQYAIVKYAEALEVRTTAGCMQDGWVLVPTLRALGEPPSPPPPFLGLCLCRWCPAPLPRTAA